MSHIEKENLVKTFARERDSAKIVRFIWLQKMSLFVKSNGRMIYFVMSEKKLFTLNTKTSRGVSFVPLYLHFNVKSARWHETAHNKFNYSSTSQCAVKLEWQHKWSVQLSFCLTSKEKGPEDDSCFKSNAPYKNILNWLWNDYWTNYWLMMAERDLSF